MTALLERPETVSDTAETECQIVAMHLGSEIYGVDIACVNTVLIPQPITPVPNVPDYVRGVMNLRGRILPVIDLRTRFGLPVLSAEQQQASRVVIMDVEGTVAGLIVDSVSEVLRLPTASIESPSSLLNAADVGCIAGIGRIPDGRLILLLDAKTLLALKPVPENSNL